MIDYALIFAPDAAALCCYSFAVITSHDFPILRPGRKSINLIGVIRDPFRFLGATDEPLGRGAG
jgi:hypothetical protein